MKTLAEITLVAPKAVELLSRGENTMTIHIPDPDWNFALMRSIWSGDPIILSEDNVQFLREVALVLGNTQLFCHTTSFELGREVLSDENVWDRLELKLQLGHDPREEVEYIAHMFSQVRDRVAQCQIQRSVGVR